MESARHHQAANLDEWAAAGELDEPVEAVLERVSYHPTAAEALAGAQFVIETVTEDLEIKTTGLLRVGPISARLPYQLQRIAHRSKAPDWLPADSRIPNAC